MISRTTSMQNPHLSLSSVPRVGALILSPLSSGLAGNSSAGNSNIAAKIISPKLVNGSGNDAVGENSSARQQIIRPQINGGVTIDTTADLWPNYSE